MDVAGAVLDQETGEMLEYRHLLQRPKYKKDWMYSFGNKIGRLAQGMPGRNEGTSTFYFIPKNDVPDERWKDVTHGTIVPMQRQTRGGRTKQIAPDVGR